jgi:hypothetical protein
MDRDKKGEDEKGKKIQKEYVAEKGVLKNPVIGKTLMS